MPSSTVDLGSALPECPGQWHSDSMPDSRMKAGLLQVAGLFALLLFECAMLSPTPPPDRFAAHLDGLRTLPRVLFASRIERLAGSLHPAVQRALGHVPQWPELTELD